MRTRRREESLAELADDIIERLVRLAYPGATEAMVELLVKYQFTDAFPDEDMRLRIRQNKPAMLIPYNSKFLRSNNFVIFVRCKLITKILNTNFFYPYGRVYWSSMQ